MPVRILYTLQSGRMGGAEHSLFYLIKNLDRDVFEPVVWLLEEGGELVERLNKINVKTNVLGLNLKIRDTRWHGVTNPLALLYDGRLVKRALKEFRQHLRSCREDFDFIHTNSWLVNNVVLLAGTDLPVIWNIRDLNKPRLRKKLIERAARVVCVSRAVRDLICEGTCQPEKFSVIYNGVDIDEFKPDVNLRARARKLMKVSEENLVIGLIGRLTPLKGQAFFLEAVADYLGTRPHVRIIVVGSSLFGKIDYRPILEKLANDLGIAGQVYFLGQQSNIPVLLNGLDIYAHPTTTKDAFPRATLEAMATCVPVLAASLGGIVEQIKHGADGLLFSKNDGRSLLSELKKLIEEPALRKVLGERARERVAENFEIEAKTREMEKMYFEVIKK